VKVVAHSYERDLNLVAQESTLRTILALGPRAADVFDLYRARHPECALSVIEEGDWIRAVEGLGIFDLVFIRGILEHLTKSEANILIGRLRDLHTQRLYALVPVGNTWPDHKSHWEQNDLIALGMERMNVYAEGGQPLHLYRFDLRTYKTTPEWFNSRYWAHPELWDRS
jgi:hypothetical protein